MGKPLLSVTSTAFLALFTACGGRVDSPGSEGEISAPSARVDGDGRSGPVAPGNAPEQVADGVGAPTAIAMTPDSVVFTTRSTTIAGSKVEAGALYVANKRIPRPLVLAVDRQGAAYDALVTDGATAFVATSDARIVAVPIAGGEARAVASLSAPAVVLTAAGGHVYFASEGGDVGRVAKTGGEPEALGTAPGAVRGLEADDAAVYVGTGGGITRIALEGHETKLLTDATEPCAMIRDGRRLFWTSLSPAAAPAGAGPTKGAAARGAVLELPLDGGAVKTVASGAFSACAIAADEKSLWFATTLTDALPVMSSPSGAPADTGLGLMRAPIAGGEPIAVAGASRALAKPGAVAVDASHVYWLTSSSVLRLRK